MTDSAVDWRLMADNLDDDSFAIKLVIDSFLGVIDGLVAAVQTALDQSDPSALAHSAHSLKGTLLNFGAREAVGLAQAIESLGHQGQIGNAARLFIDLKQQIAIIIDELKIASVRFKEAG